MLSDSLADFAPQDFRAAQAGLQREIEELQALRLEMMKEKRTLETVMYMMYPKEAARDGYLGASRAIAARLRRAKEARDAKDPVRRSSKPSAGALSAEEFVRRALAAARRS